MQIQFSDHFNYGKLLRFTLLTIVMMIFTFICSNQSGYAFTPIHGCIGFMFGIGGSADYMKKNEISGYEPLEDDLKRNFKKSNELNSR